MNGFTARFDEGDGTDLRHVEHGGEEVAARIYFAVRDDRWRTVPLVVLDRTLEHDADGFRLTVGGRTAWPELPVAFELEYRARGSRLECRFTGRAGSSFRFNRIGFCVLAPLGFAGAPLTLSTASGDVTGEFPVEIAPQLYVDGAPVPLFGASFSGLTTTLPTDTTVGLAFTGDEFEVEDQRNWSDASYKMYGTPLSLGFPFDAVDGQGFAQSVVLDVAPGAGRAAESADPEVVVGAAIGVLPRVGLYEPGEPPGVWRPEVSFPDLNRTRPGVAELGDVHAVAVGINGSVHADDRWSIAETAFVHGAIARQIHDLYPGLELRLRPLDFARPAGNWMRPDGVYTHTPAPGSDHPLRHEPFAAAWLVASLGALAGGPAVSVDAFDPGLADAPVGRLVADLAPLAGAPVHRVDAPTGLGALAIAGDDGIQLLLANPGTRPRDVVVRGAGPLRLEADEVVRLPLPIDRRTP